MKRKRGEHKEENNVLKEYKKYFNKRPPDKLIFHDIRKKLPPNNGETVLLFDPVFGYEIGTAAIVLQHIHHDIDTLKFSRTTHWARLKIKSE